MSTKSKPHADRYDPAAEGAREARRQNAAAKKGKSTRQKCSRCKRHLALDRFSPYSRGKSGRWCRACKKAHRQSKQSTTQSKEA